MNYIKESIIAEQKHIIGIEPVMDINNFALLLLADMASKSKIFYSDKRNSMTASLPLNYCEIIEKIMYEENGWGIKFAELIDIYSYYENQSDWEMELGATISKILQDEKLKSDLDLECSHLNIHFTKAQIEEIKSRFDEEALDIMDHFSNLLGAYVYTRQWSIESNEMTRNSNRYQYNTYKCLYYECIREGIKNPQKYIKEFNPTEKHN